MSSHPQPAPLSRKHSVTRPSAGPPREGFRQVGFYLNPLRFLAGLQRKYGDLVSFHFMRYEAILISDPELIREVLVTLHANFIKGPALQRSRVFLGEGCSRTKVLLIYASEN